MKTTKDFKRFIAELTIGVFLVSTINPVPAFAAMRSSDEVIYPLKQVSKLECRFKEFNDLSSNCKQDLPVLKTKYYTKYATKNGGYNDFTRLYTVLWGASYKYGWDIGNGGHIGTDIATSKGTPVYTIADGKVIKAKTDKMLGNYISIEHYINGKKVFSNYAHLSKIKVKVGENVKVGEKIGEVGSTGNSTGNHLHFQIDLDTPFHPYYYDYNMCPFSYYKITENGVCFDELTKNTIDPLLFLETKGKILDNIKTIKYKKISTNTSTKNTKVKNTKIKKSKNNYNNLSIFNKTVHIGYPKNDIKEVQKIYKKLGFYNGKISGKYEDIEKDIIRYQIERGVIKTKNSLGAGWFGPKTRYQTKKDYLNKNYSKIVSTNNSKKEITQIKTQKIKKISRKHLMSREEIEKKEVDDFLKNYKLEFNFSKQGSNIKKDSSEILKLSITNKKGRAFKGTMPGGMTFVTDASKVSVFPKKLFYFTDGKRDIYLTGKTEGNTSLHIKIGNVIIKTIKLKIYNGSKAIYPESAQILGTNKITLGDKTTGIILFKDESGKNLINLKYGSTFNIKASDTNKVCIKKGDLKNIKNVFKSNCNEEDYKNEHNFSYNDTVGGLLIYDIKATSKDFKLSITNNYDNKQFDIKKMIVSNPKGLNKTYVYTNEVMDMLQKGIVNGINKGYFQENKQLNQIDAFNWIENTLTKINNNTYDYSTKNIIESKLNNIKIAKKTASKYKVVTRKDFLNLSYEYLTIENNENGNIFYRDIDEATTNKLSKVFNADTTWKDRFGEKYFRPDEKITRGEGAYFLSKTLERTNKSFLTLR